MVRSVYRLRHFVLSKFFKLLYHQFAFSYDFVASLVSLGLWKAWVFCAQEYLKGPKILEMGHGPGHLLRALSELGLWVTGLDESWQMQKLAQQNLENAGLKLKSVNAIAQTLPFKSDLFDQVVATFPSDYITDPLTLKEIYRVLLPGGKLIVIPVAWITGKKWVQRFAARLFKITGEAPELNQVFEHKWLQIFGNAGFQVQCEYLNLGSSLVFILICKKP